MNIFIGITLCLWSVAVVPVYGETFSQCVGVPSQTFIASPEGCEYYIYCDNQESFQDKCLDNLMFNVKDGSCDIAENVDCDPNAGASSSQTTLTTQVGSTSTPISVTTTPTSLTTSATSIFSPTASSTSASISTIVPITTTPSTSTSASAATTTSSGQIQCPNPSRPEEIAYLPNPTSCTDYYMCYRGTPIPMTCPVDLHFNPVTGSCDWAESANCKIVGPTTVSPRVLCTNTTSGYFDYPSNCHYYYRCTNGMLMVQECPVGFGWDSGKKMCTKNGCPAMNS